MAHRAAPHKCGDTTTESAKVKKGLYRADGTHAAAETLGVGVDEVEIEIPRQGGAVFRSGPIGIFHPAISTEVFNSN